MAGEVGSHGVGVVGQVPVELGLTVALIAGAPPARLEVLEGDPHKATSGVHLGEVGVFEVLDDLVLEVEVDLQRDFVGDHGDSVPRWHPGRVPDAGAAVRVEFDPGDPFDAEVTAGALWGLGATAVVEGGDNFLAGFETAADAEAAIIALGRGVLVAGTEERWVMSAPVGPSGVRIGRLLVVGAGHPRPDPAPGVVVVEVDAGRSFGSGAHPTTRLVLGEIDRLVAPGSSVLDVGSGSGVLSVAAGLLGAGPIVAVDTDAEARRSTEANARAAGLADAVTVVEEVPAGSFDLVVANLVAPTLRDLAGALSTALSSTGALVVSGLLAGQWASVARWYPALRVERMFELEGWEACTLRR